jgi:hypothetical protein
MDNCSCKSCQNTDRSERLARPSTIYKRSDSWHCNVWFHGIGVAMLQHSEAIMNLVQRCVTASLAREARRSAPPSSALSALPAWQGNHMRHQTSNASPGLYFLRLSICLHTTRCQRHQDPWLLMCPATPPVLCTRDQHRRYHGVWVSRYGWTRFTPPNLGRITSAQSRYDSW